MTSFKGILGVMWGSSGSIFCMEFILHEILKYKLNNLHVLIFLHVVCFYFAYYSSILKYLLGLLGYYNIMQVRCSSAVPGIP